jgi:D-alanyl-lipoteichoic acid acyltransferase DltB (MBOAT superfamily)
LSSSSVRRDVGAFALIAAQVGLLFLVADAFQIERTYGFHRLAPIVFGGFLVNAWLPMRLRSWWFLALFAAAVLTLLGPVEGLTLLAAALGLFGLCHLPVPFGARVGLIVAVAALLAGLRAGWLEIPFEARRLQMYLQTQTVPLLASLFMFRGAVYLYDLRHEKKPAPLAERLSYFFLLPAPCFPLFPVVDYQAFRRTRYGRPDLLIYQKGADWILRGIVQLLLYRFVYQYLTPDPARIHDLAGVVQYMVSSFLLYLRISGLFHLIVGILCLFGFDLPETHHRYFLASSFNDFWRRINIYWKDFMMKLFYFPVFMAMRRRGTTFAMIVATMATFVCTWLLHAYQWFWLRGSFPLPLQDAIFWGALAVLVTINSLWETSRGRERTLSAGATRTWRQAAGLSLRTVAMFSFLCVLWSFWTCTTIAEWMSVASVAVAAPAGDFLRLAAVLAGLVVVGIVAQLLQGRVRAPAAGAPALQRAALVGGTSLVLLAAASPEVQPGLGPLAEVLGTVKGDRLSARDKDRMVRGYYEDLLGVESWGSMLWSIRVEEPEDWRWGGRPTAEFLRETGDFRGAEYAPNVDTVHKGAPFRTNRWGLRGPDFDREKPEGTCRILLLDSSFGDGAGVEVESTFAGLLERALNGRPPSDRWSAYQVINLSLPGDSIVRQMAALSRIGLQFRPDAVIVVATTNEELHAVRNVSDAVAARAPDIDPEVSAILERAGIDVSMSDEEIERRLNGVSDEILGWGYRTLARTAAEHGLEVFWCLLPLTDDDDRRVTDSFDRLSPLVSAEGLTPVSLEGVYGDLNERDRIRLAPWDWHPNREGHALIAQRLERELRGQGFLEGTPRMRRPG